VWKARDRRLGRIVAVKIPHAHPFDADRRAVLLREARAAACLSHPGIVSIHEVSVIGAEGFLVYEYIEGTSLSTWLSQNRFSHREAAAVCLDLARAAGHAHERGIVHRDLKPSNILIDGARVLRITDFGLSKRCVGSSDATRDGLIMGSVPYMSPEQAAGNARAADARTDIYALGVILYELLTGEAPFRADDPDVLFKILHQQPREPRTIDPNVPEELQAICLQAMAKRVADRYPAASVLADDLARFLSGERVFALRRIGRTTRWLRSHSKALVSAALVAPLAIALFAAATSGPHDEVAGANARTQARPSSSPIVERAVDPNLIAHPAFRPRPVEIRTNPSGAEVWVFPRDRLTGAVRPRVRIGGSSSDRRFAPAEFELSPGDYLIVAELADGRFTAISHHVPLRSELVPTWQSSLDWHRDRRKEYGIWIDVEIPVAQHLDGMVLVPAGNLTVHSGDREVRLTFPPFYLGSGKVDYGAYRSFRVQGGAIVPDAVPDYLQGASLSNSDVMLLTYADAETLLADAGFRFAEQAELAYAASLNGDVHGLDSGPDELTGTWYAPSPWTVGDKLRGLQYEMQRTASPEVLLPLVRSHLVFETQPVERRNSISLGAEQPNVRFVDFREKPSAFAVRAARHARAPRDESDFIRFKLIDP
jgi:serine/threonine-protein kinase